MIITRSYMDQTWTDLHSPTKEEIDSLVSTKHIDPIIAKDLLTPTPKQRTSVSGNTIYAVIHIPFFKHTHDVSSEQEIDFIITKHGVVTTRYESIDALHLLGKQIETDQILHKEAQTHLFFRMIKEIYQSLFDEIDYMRDWTKHIEKSIFEGKEREMVFGISSASRNLLNFKRIIDPHKNVWNSLSLIAKGMDDDSFEHETSMLIEEWERLNSEIQSVKDMIDELRDTNDSIVSTKQNEIMKTFTILAFVAFPLSLIAAIFGMNSAHMPIIGGPYDFWIIVGIMFCVSLAMFTYFKYKKWI